MATSKGNIESQEYNKSPIIKGNKAVWFLNKDLVRVHHYNRSGGTVALYNIIKDKIELCFILDFKKNREKAYTIAETAQLVNRHRKYMPSLIKRGIIPPPIGSSKDGKTGFVTSKNVDDLATAINRFLQDPILIKAYGTNAKVWLH